MTERFERINDPKTRSFVRERMGDIVRAARKGRALGNRLYLLPYDPAQQADANDLVDVLIKQDLPEDGIRAIEVNLYDIVLETLDDMGVWEPLCAAEAEPDVDRDDLIMTLQDGVDPHDVLAPAVMERIGRASADGRCDLAFITGVGETFPYVRTHNLLESLDTETPVVLMFPGQYRRSSGGSSSLDILNIPSARNGGHYRATNVFDL